MQTRRDFDPDPDSPAAVRAFVCESADGDLSHFALTVDSDGRFRLSSEDLSAKAPQHDASGNGPNGPTRVGQELWIVDALSTRWGVDATPTGKQVWAEVAAEAS